MTIASRLRRLEQGTGLSRCPTCNGRPVQIIWHPRGTGRTESPPAPSSDRCGTRALQANMWIAEPDWDGWTQFPDLAEQVIEATGIDPRIGPSTRTGWVVGRWPHDVPL